MSYCALADLQKVKTTAELVQLADLDGDTAADSSTVDAACETASAEIDGWLGRVMTVPVASPPDRLLSCAVNLALYYLAFWRGSVTEDLRKQYEAEIAWLKAVSEKTAALGSSTASPAAAAVVADDREFTRDKLSGF